MKRWGLGVAVCAVALVGCGAPDVTADEALGLAREECALVMLGRGMAVQSPDELTASHYGTDPEESWFTVVVSGVDGKCVATVWKTPGEPVVAEAKRWDELGSA